MLPLKGQRDKKKKKTYAKGLPRQRIRRPLHSVVVDLRRRRRVRVAHAHVEAVDHKDAIHLFFLFLFKVKGRAVSPPGPPCPVQLTFSPTRSSTATTP